MTRVRLYRARVFSPVADPFKSEVALSYVAHEDGYVAVDEAGRIADVGAWPPPAAEGHEVIDLGRNALLSPGFIDTHLHAPQLEMIGSYGGHLLEWLNRYTFPTEAKFSDPEHARVVAKAFFDVLLRHGTLCALVFSTIHAEATDIFFAEAERRGFRGLIGKTMMDRNAPEYLLENAKDSYEQSRALLQKWHGRGLLHYAITPRFAPTSTPELLERAGDLKREFPGAYVHTHISENRNEVEWVHQLFPEAEYADVYDRYGLLSEKSVLAHGVHLSDEELDLLRARKSRIAHCPNSNLFLGSGLFPLHRILDAGVVVGLGSDIGAGTTPSLFTAMADAYKVQQVQSVSLSPFHLWYLATLGGACALSLDAETGSLEAGKSADFLVLDIQATPLLAMRGGRATSMEDLLAAFIFIGDDRAVREAYIGGQRVSGSS
ncbi:MAG TPA: guanine deaminase [Thermoanaerobaculia bacterium]|jgi:guanine deaminase|nr:guanine deaminase [Thermoanaerobaculia bacterium]